MIIEVRIRTECGETISIGNRIPLNLQQVLMTKIRTTDLAAVLMATGETPMGSREHHEKLIKRGEVVRLVANSLADELTVPLLKMVSENDTHNGWPVESEAADAG